MSQPHHTLDKGRSSRSSCSEAATGGGAGKGEKAEVLCRRVTGRRWASKGLEPPLPLTYSHIRLRHTHTHTHTDKRTLRREVLRKEETAGRLRSPLKYTAKQFPFCLKYWASPCQALISWDYLGSNEMN